MGVRAEGKRPHEWPSKSVGIVAEPSQIPYRSTSKPEALAVVALVVLSGKQQQGQLVVSWVGIAQDHLPPGSDVADLLSGLSVHPK